MLPIKLEFVAELVQGDRGGVGIYIPFNVQEVFGTRAQVKVRGTIDELPFRSSIAPMGGGKHAMVVKKEIRDAIGKTVGDRVKMVMAKDNEKRIVTVPEDFRIALEQNPIAKTVFDKFAFTHRREYVEWIESAKKPETRFNRIQKAVAKIAAGTKFS